MLINLNRLPGPGDRLPEGSYTVHGVVTLVPVVSWVSWPGNADAQSCAPPAASYVGGPDDPFEHAQDPEPSWRDEVPLTWTGADGRAYKIFAVTTNVAGKKASVYVVFDKQGSPLVIPNPIRPPV